MIIARNLNIVSKEKKMLTLYRTCITALKSLLAALRGPGAPLPGIVYRVNVPFTAVFRQPGNKPVYDLIYGQRIKISYISGQAIKKGRVAALRSLWYWAPTPGNAWVFMEDVKRCNPPKGGKNHADHSQNSS